MALRDLTHIKISLYPYLVTPTLPLADLFQALADPTRVRILALLRIMELSVGELALVLGQSQPRVSRHIHHRSECPVDTGSTRLGRGDGGILFDQRQIIFKHLLDLSLLPIKAGQLHIEIGIRIHPHPGLLY